MAKRTRVAARGKPASKTRLTHPRNGGQEIGPQKTSRTAVREKTTLKTVPGILRIANAVKARRIVFTPEVVAYVRHLYEQTDASLGEIAIDLRVHKDTVRRLAKRGGWLRYVRPPRALSTAAQLVVQTSELEAQVLGEAVAARRARSDAEKSRGAEVQLQAEESQTILDAGAAMPALADTVARLYRAVLEELAAVEALRAQLRREPQSRHGAERTARTLSSLTETLQKLQRLQCAFSQSESYDDDIPADIDEFRTELARRIEAFVASRSDPGPGCGSGAASVNAAAG